MSDNVNVLIEKMNQESLKKRQAANKKKFGINEGKSGGNVYGSNLRNEGSEDDGTGVTGKVTNTVANAAYGAGMQGGSKMTHGDGHSIGAEVAIGNDGLATKGKAGGAGGGSSM